MKKLLLAYLCFFFFSPVFADGPIRRNATFQAYIDKYKDLAITEMNRYGIPASITLAQGLLESGAGRSDLTVRGNNHFGIKCHGWDGRSITHDDDANGECFRAYDSPLQSFEDHSKFLAGRSRYSSLFSLSHTDYKGWANGLKACGYATNPRYAQNLIDPIESYQLYMYDTPSTRTSASNLLAARQQTVSTPAVAQRRLHPIHRYNDNYYLRARQGDSYESIGREVEISGRELANANEQDRRTQLQEGDIVYLKKKAKRAEKRYKNCPHTVRNGESLYTIAQLYGVRLKSLVKMNPQLAMADYQVRVGDRIRVY